MDGSSCSKGTTTTSVPWHRRRILVSAPRMKLAVCSRMVASTSEQQSSTKPYRASRGGEASSGVADKYTRCEPLFAPISSTAFSPSFLRNNMQSPGSSSARLAMVSPISKAAGENGALKTPYSNLSGILSRYNIHPFWQRGAHRLSAWATVASSRAPPPTTVESVP